jgi:hypothetical protein
MKKWFIALLISLAAFCFFFYMNGFSGVIDDNSIYCFGYALYGIYIAGIAVPWYLVSALAALCLIVYIIFLVIIQVKLKTKYKKLLLLTLLLPATFITFQSQERIYSRWTSPGMTDVGYYQTIKLSEADSTVTLSDPVPGINYMWVSETTFSAPASVIRKIDSLNKDGHTTYIMFVIRKNLLLNSRRLDTAYIGNHDLLYSEHLMPQYYSELTKNLVFEFRNIDDIFR